MKKLIFFLTITLFNFNTTYAQTYNDNKRLCNQFFEKHMGDVFNNRNLDGIIIIQSVSQAYACKIDRAENEITFYPVNADIGLMELNYTISEIEVYRKNFGTDFTETVGLKSFPIDPSKPKASNIREAKEKKQAQSKQITEKKRKLLIVEVCLKQSRQKEGFVESKFWKDNLDNDKSGVIVIGYTSNWLGEQKVECNVK